MSELRTKDEVEQTIRHEIGHAIDVEIRGTSAHDRIWENIAKQCGYTGERTSEISDDDALAIYKWLGVCETHGVLGGWIRKPKRGKMCRKCRKIIKIIPIDEYKR